MNKKLTTEDIIRIARHVGYSGFDSQDERLHEFADIVVAIGQEAEREACAQVCDAEATIEGIAQRCAANIRARGSK